MTEKLYDNDSYQTEFDAVVLSCEASGDGYKTILDKTVFFPEEGGQSCDTGHINGIEITFVELCGDTIVHYSKAPFEPGSTVHGVIDFAPRYRKMQNHTGEHIICGIAHKLYGCENVGFHLGADYVTMDLDKPLTSEDIAKIEVMANEAVYSNVPVTAYYPTEDELKITDYRSKSDIIGKVRLVNIEGYDICACCAPHVTRTGEVGIIKILDCINYKGGVRLSILCGRDALSDYNDRLKRNIYISNLLSVKQEDVCTALDKLMEDMASLRQQIGEKSKLISKLYTDSISETDENICIITEGLSSGEMRHIVNGIMTKTTKSAAVFCGNDQDGYSYIIGSLHINLKEAAPQINSALCGRGGGTPQMIQGSVKANEKQIEVYFTN